MRNETKPHEDSATRVVPSVPWRLHAVYPLEAYRLYVKFIDGTEGFVDLSSLVKSEHAGVFSKSVIMISFKMFISTMEP